MALNRSMPIGGRNGCDARLHSGHGRRLLRECWLLGIGVWLALSRSPKPVEFVRRVRLTSFAPELAVTASAISADGSLVAYANSSGLFVQQIATGETRGLATPARGFETSTIRWFPSGDKLLVDGLEPQALIPSLWSIALIGNANPVKLGNYPPAVVSPDGRRFAFVVDNGGRPALALVKSDGGAMRTVSTGSTGETFGGICWSPDGRRVVYTRLRWDAQLRRNTGSIDSYDSITGRNTTILAGSDFGGDLAFVSDRQLLYSRLLGSNPSALYGSELVEVDVDLEAARAVTAPVVVSQWSAPIAGLSASRTGARILLRDAVEQHSVLFHKSQTPVSCCHSRVV